MFQTKPQIALDLIDRSLANGVRVAAWTFDELYGRDTKFLDGLQQRQQAFVGEVPCTFHGWVREPDVIFPREKTGQAGRPESRTRVAKRYRSCEVRNFLKHSPLLRKKKWQRYRIKDTGTGPQIWEIKWTNFWRKDADGLPVASHCLIVAKNVLTGEVKYFLSNRVPGRGGVTLRWLLRVAFGRWSVESVFRETKDELGLDHYQCRGWECIHRHYAVTAVSHLFCARIRQAFDETDGHSPGRLSVEQVRRAMNVWLSAADLSATKRRERYQAELDKQAYYQRHSEQSAASHHKTRIAQYHAMGIDPDRIKSCIPLPDS